ncbi:hypothetical protein [Desulfurobacterium indicum]|uniref:Uncharacterized protein n=1 Tax=Desulfurobacterium indicum TaxID=1914305 RepID=A0A1R1ML12_9BACT|nr:hypothetical protein [Desulfurobacterium indicum]OMH40384.1 hypothetical protein BLW93_05515 [Desulfurobacterium indicum]
MVKIMKKQLMEIYKELFNEDYIEKSQERCQNSKCLWLVINILSVSKNFGIDLGIKKQRKKRPMITTKKVNSNYLCIFLTSKSKYCGHDLEPIEINLQKCNKLCDSFYFKKQSYKFIHVHHRKGAYKKVFKIPEYFIKNKNLFEFCGVCGD